MDPLFISVVSACTALVASIAGPLVTLAVARRQFNANVLSVNRQKWIETLRGMLAELISLLVSALVTKAGWKGKWDKGLGVVTANPAMREKLERLVLVQWNIRLLMNPTEPDHQQLYQTIESALLRGCSLTNRTMPRRKPMSRRSRHWRKRFSNGNGGELSEGYDGR